MKKELLKKIIEKKNKKIEFAIITNLEMVKAVFLKKINLCTKIL